MADTNPQFGTAFYYGVEGTTLTGGIVATWDMDSQFQKKITAEDEMGVVIWRCYIDRTRTLKIQVQVNEALPAEGTAIAVAPSVSVAGVGTEISTTPAMPAKFIIEKVSYKGKAGDKLVADLECIASEGITIP